MTLWSGRFEGRADPLFKRFNDSLPFDYRLVEHDIIGSIGWAKALGAAGALRPEEVGALVDALEDLKTLAVENLQAVRDSGEEDVHTWVEARLIEKVGDLGKKLHTGRSRNDQVATDLRLYARQEAARRVDEIRAAQAALVQLAQREGEAVFPGYTHLQRAQPIIFGHWCLAYFEMLDRDADRFGSAHKRANSCPLGSAALAGTAYPIDRAALAESLGFDGPTANSLDGVSDRDFVIEMLSAASITALHLSRLAEDMIIYCSAEFGFVELADAFSSGSSLMPQKKNPDALELIRGKTGRIISDLTSLCITLKGLPLAYNKDLQEDKQPLFDAMDELSLSLRVVAAVLDGLSVRHDAARQAAQGGHANATDLADYLVERGMPFREAHHAVGRIVRHALRQNLKLEELPIEQMQAIAPVIMPDVRERLTLDAVLSRRDVEGGTAPHRVRQAIERAAARLRQHGVEPAQPRDAIEVREARIDDLDAICDLVEYWARQGENLPRNRDAIMEAIADFGVAVKNGHVIGCGSLSLYTATLAEIRSLGIDPAFHGGGAGAKLVRYFLERAADLHIPKVFALTRVPRFFEKLGFKVVDIASLPEKIRKDCQQCPKQHCCDEIAVVHEIEIEPDEHAADEARIGRAGEVEAAPAPSNGSLHSLPVLHGASSP